MTKDLTFDPLGAVPHVRFLQVTCERLERSCQASRNSACVASHAVCEWKSVLLSDADALTWA